MQRQIVLAQHGQHIYAFLVRRTEHFDDLAFGIGVARFPFLQLDHDLVADIRLATYIARFSHVNVLLHARIIRPHVKELPPTLQRADDLRTLTFENADDRAGFLLRAAIGSQPARTDFATNEHAVTMQRCAGVAFGNHDLLHGRIVRAQKAFALAIDLNRARDEICFLRENVTIAFGARDASSLRQRQ